MVEFIGYTVEFPCETEVPVMSALSSLRITSPRSAKRKANHFYNPYTPSKRRSSSASATMRPVLLSQAATVPLRRAASLEAKTINIAETVVVPQVIREEQPKPWGKLVSRTEGKLDIDLRRSSTGVGEDFHFVDMDTGERVIQFCTSLV